jgi:WD40 repeat protein
VWRFASRQVISGWTAPDTTGGVTALAFSRAMLATCQGNGSISLRDLAIRTLTTTLTDPRGFVNGAPAVAFSPDGALLAAGDASGHLRLWDAATFKVIATWTVPGGAGILAVAFSHDDNTLRADRPGTGTR